MKSYRKKPVVIEAFQWTGDINQTEDPEWMIKAIENGSVFFSNAGTKGVSLNIRTLEGVREASRGDYIIQGVNGEIYPCKHDIFEKTYEEVKS